jgi:murein tripeptide amidase MpaA
MKTTALIFGAIFFQILQAQEFLTPYEKSAHKATATYAECREWYRMVQRNYPEICSFDSIGTGDEGFPIYTFRMYTGQNLAPLRILIMNNIHPGEPEGTDASMLMVKDIIKDSKKTREILKNIDLNIICQYNVDGTVNQSCCTRANQNGPELLGFRGNAKNLDLNRDFIKCDSKNARAFVK